MRLTRFVFLLAAMPAAAQSLHWSSTNGFTDDKKRHVVVGALIGGTVYSIAEKKGAKYPALWAIGAAVTAGVIKEKIDRNRGFRPEGADVAATAAGAGLACVTFKIRF